MSIIEQSSIVRKKIQMLVADEKALEDEVCAILTEGGSVEEALKTREFTVNSIVEGTIVRVRGDEVMIDIGYKSEGVVMVYEFSDPGAIKVDDKIKVLIESIEDEFGDDLVEISKRKADRILVWSQIVEEKKEGDIVTGRITRKIKGGLLVDIGVPVFLPASQVDLRRAADIGEYVGQTIDCVILKIDEARKNIVVSRRKLLEKDREKKRDEFMGITAEGDIVKGRVKNIADFGAFIDLGGVDGLLHITDMSWGRVEHPSKIVRIGDDIEVKILSIDKNTGKVALGLKQKSDSPWSGIEDKYPVGSIIKGEVVNTTNYGAFVRLENGIEGLVHISEMSWTKRVSHPSELVAKGDAVEVMVLNMDKEKQEISLGMKQVEENPWDHVEDKYPAGTVVKGKVRNITNYGAFIELEEGVDGLLHVSDISWTKKINHPKDAIKKEDEIEGVVLSVDKEKKRVSIGLKQLEDDPWIKDIPERYKTGDIITGKVKKTASFGAFIELEPALEGLLHVSGANESEIEEMFNPGEEIEVMVSSVDLEERKIALSRAGDDSAIPPSVSTKAETAIANAVGADTDDNTVFPIDPKAETMVMKKIDTDDLEVIKEAKAEISTQELHVEPKEEATEEKAEEEKTEQDTTEEEKE